MRRKISVRNRGWILALVAAGCALAASAQNKDTFTPMALDSGFGSMDLTPSSVAPEQIVKEFAARRASSKRR